MKKSDFKNLIKEVIEEFNNSKELASALGWQPLRNSGGGISAEFDVDDIMVVIKEYNHMFDFMIYCENEFLEAGRSYPDLETCVRAARERAHIHAQNFNKAEKQLGMSIAATKSFSQKHK